MRHALASLLLALCCGLPSLAAAQQRYWYDGDQRRALWSDPAWIAEFDARPAEKAPALRPATAAKTPAAKSSPVFRDGAGDGSPRRALPGGVIVRFAPGTGEATRQALIAKHGLVPERAIGGDGERWLLRSESGLASLELANRLYESGDFAAASPNWWRPRALK